MTTLPTQSQNFDLNGCLERLENDEEILEELVYLFLEDAPKKFEELELALAKSDMELALHGFHSLKSASGTTGAVKVQVLARQAEEKLKAEESFDGLSETLEEIKSCFEDYRKLF